MKIRELLRRLLDHAIDGRGGDEPVLIRCDGRLFTIASVETHIADSADHDGNELFVLVVADGPSVTVEASPTTMRAPRV
jgi:hypothetical protein